jgi:xanthine dehydrogenase accessory factor
MRVSIVRLDPARMLETVRRISDQLNSGQRVHLATHREGDQALIIHPVTHSAHSTDEVFTQLIDPTPALLIIGAGHIGRALARLACDLEFTVFVHDDRAEWLTDSAFPNCRALELTLDAALVPLQQWEGMCFAALVTRGFAQDVAALQQLRTIPNWKYIGLLGSKRRITKVLADQDPWPHEVLHAPTGIEIAAETPMEIAISIAAEMIQVMRDAKGRTAISAME